VRSFLDHDRPFIAPTRAADPSLEAAVNAVSDASYVDNATGQLVTPAAAFFSLVEHWKRWAACLGKHGLLVLEVSSLDVASTFKFCREATSMHFDCVQAHSGQMLMPATHFSLGAATAGLLPSPGTLTYPKDSPYTRIVLQQLRPSAAGLAIRIASLSDMPQLLALEAFWRSHVLSADEATLKQRLLAHPTGQLVIEAPGGDLVAAMYTQRVASSKTLLTTTRETESELHVPSGPVIQLLGVVQSPKAAQLMKDVTDEARSVGQMLRDYVLHLGRLDPTAVRACGVTRCRDYSPQWQGPTRSAYERHVATAQDGGLLFHSDAGAVVGKLVPGYRPHDLDNLGFGVMITYELKKGGKLGTNAKAASAPKKAPTRTLAAVPPTLPARPVLAPAAGLPTTQAEAEEVVMSVIDGLSYGEARAWTASERLASLMDLGIDSLDATKLIANLNARLAPHLVLASTIMFEHSNVRELATHVHRELATRTPKTAPTQRNSAPLASPSRSLPMPSTTSKPPAPRPIAPESVGDMQRKVTELTMLMQAAAEKESYELAQQLKATRDELSARLKLPPTTSHASPSALATGTYSPGAFERSEASLEHPVPGFSRAEDDAFYCRGSEWAGLPYWQLEELARQRVGDEYVGVWLAQRQASQKVITLEMVAAALDEPFAL